MLFLLLLAAVVDYSGGRILPQDFVVSNDLTDRVDEAIVTVSVSSKFRTLSAFRQQLKFFKSLAKIKCKTTYKIRDNYEMRLIQKESHSALNVEIKATV